MSLSIGLQHSGWTHQSEQAEGLCNLVSEVYPIISHRLLIRSKSFVSFHSEVLHSRDPGSQGPGAHVPITHNSIFVYTQHAYPLKGPNSNNIHTTMTIDVPSVQIIVSRFQPSPNQGSFRNNRSQGWSLYLYVPESRKIFLSNLQLCQKNIGDHSEGLPLALSGMECEKGDHIWNYNPQLECIATNPHLYRCPH